MVVSHREPYIHHLSGREITWNRPVGGLTEALDPLLRAAGGIWVAHGSGSADKKVVDVRDRVAVPPDSPEYTLRRVWLTPDEIAGFYLGFSNQALWPLCHIAFTAPVFREADWKTYRKVNRIFADAVLKESAGRRAVVLVQDYHFAMLPGILRKDAPDMTIGQFWHIPWPPYEVFRTCPWHEEIIAGMLGNDLLGFHIGDFCRNFVESAGHLPGAATDRRGVSIARDGRKTFVQPFPISVDFAGISGQSRRPEVRQEMERLSRRYRLDGKIVGIGLDRIDYTKGIPERLLALDKFLEDNPGYRGKVVFIQAGMPSRTDIGTYRDLARRVRRLIKDVNEKYTTGDWQPVISLTGQLSRETLGALRNLADFCVVSSLHDGMNLVAKEYVAARNDGDGVLVLSRFTGAAEELADAILINPFATNDFAARLKEALTMPETERRRRMKNMRRVVAGNDIFHWGAGIVSRLLEMAGA
ncbi:MAG: trehalose-6-phosphate synthase [Chloroflexi bacterium RBG_16_56_11]|nr:MAG: trehalose-6-phosphate synthase [Chloroflexi bacterium RBG_16_56_11]